MSKLGALHVTNYKGIKHTATIILFHGSGGTGESFKQWVDLLLKNFSFPHIKVVYPTAPLQPYTAAGGLMSNVWFDRLHISPDVPEDVISLIDIETEVRNLIKKENEAGIPNNRIMLGGFSMGGALALHAGYRWVKNVNSVFAFSSFLNDKSLVYQELSTSSGTLPPLLQLHGESDELVDLKWGVNTFKELENLGVKGEFHILPRLGHSLNKRGLHIIKEWVDKKLPQYD